MPSPLQFPRKLSISYNVFKILDNWSKVAKATSYLRSVLHLQKLQGLHLEHCVQVTLLKLCFDRQYSTVNFVVLFIFWKITDFDFITNLCVLYINAFINLIYLGYCDYRNVVFAMWLAVHNNRIANHVWVYHLWSTLRTIRTK